MQSYTIKKLYAQAIKKKKRQHPSVVASNSAIEMQLCMNKYNFTLPLSLLLLEHLDVVTDVIGTLLDDISRVTLSVTL